MSIIKNILKNKRLLLGLAIIILLAAYLLWGPLNLWGTLSKYANESEIDKLITKLRGYGPWTPIISLFFLILQAILFPIPIWPLATANALIFGAIRGFLLTWIGVLMGAIAAYHLGSWLGMHRLSRYIKLSYLKYLEEFTGKHGFKILLIARIMPITNLDILSYLAGICKMNFLRFIAASALGTIPWILFYTIFAHNLLLAKQLGVWIGLGITLVVAGLIILRYRKNIASFIKSHQAESE